jgi:hypothetical protein
MKKIDVFTLYLQENWYGKNREFVPDLSSGAWPLCLDNSFAKCWYLPDASFPLLIVPLLTEKIKQYISQYEATHMSAGKERDTFAENTKREESNKLTTI